MITCEQVFEATSRSKRDERWRFLPHTFAARVSAGEWQASRHLAYIGRRVGAAINAGGARLVINMPAGYGKSLFTSRWLPTWYLSGRPTHNVILAANTKKLASEHGEWVRNTAASMPGINFRLRSDSTAKARWHTHAGGGMLCDGVGGAITGFRANLLLIDDPYSDWDDAWSSTTRTAVERWFDSTAYKRVDPGGSIVVLHHRFHPRDLSGYLTEHHGDKWEHIRLPTIAEGDDQLGRAPGEVLWPERWPAERVLHEKAITPTHIWDAMDRQDPGVGAAGLAYQHFGQHNLMGPAELVPGLPIAVSFDFNLNPGMYCLVGQYDAKADRFVAANECFGSGWNVEQLMPALVKMLRGYAHLKPPWIEVFGDATGGGTSMNDGWNSYVLIRKSLAEAHPKVHVRVPKANPGIINSLIACNEALRDNAGRSHVSISPRCVRLLDDLRQVIKDDEGKIDKTNKQLTHPSDCLRYWTDYERPVGGRKVMARGKIGAVGDPL